MMKHNPNHSAFTVLLLVMFATNFAKAQKIPLEFFGGDKAFNSQLILNKPLSERSKFGFFSLVNYNLPYDKEDKIYKFYNIQSSVTYHVTKHLRVFGGASIKNIDYGVTAGIQLIIPIKNWFFLIHNGNDLTENFHSQFMVLAEYKPKLNDKINLYTRVQVMQETDYQNFTRGFQMIRLGIGIKQFQFGVGANFDQFGVKPIRYENTGVFIRAIL